MRILTFKQLDWIYYILCCLATVALLIYSLYRYVRNDDTTSIQIRTFFTSKDAIYPSLSICMFQPFLSDKFDVIGDAGISMASYINVLNGEYWDDRILMIDYDNVTVSFSDHLIKSVYVTHANNMIDWKPDHYVNFRSSKRKCFNINAPVLDKNLLWKVKLMIKNDILSKGMTSKHRLIRIYMHYPGQRFTSYYTGINFNSTLRHNKSQCFDMKFKVKNIDVTTRRNKIWKPCIDEVRDYDDHFMENMMYKTGCRPPHWKSTLDLPTCSNAQQMKYFSNQPHNFDVKNFKPPCKAIERLDYFYREEDHECQRNESYFWITQEFRQTSFLDKMQVRAYTFDDLVGACGGYIGLFLGYALIQIPRAITLRFNVTKARNNLHETDKMNKNINTEDV